MAFHDCLIVFLKLYIKLLSKLIHTYLYPWTVACQVPLFMEFSRQEEYWSGLAFPPGDLPDPGIEPVSPAFKAVSLPAEPSGKPHTIIICVEMSMTIFRYHYGQWQEKF